MLPTSIPSARKHCAQCSAVAAAAAAAAVVVPAVATVVVVAAAAAVVVVVAAASVIADPSWLMTCDSVSLLMATLQCQARAA